MQRFFVHLLIVLLHFLVIDGFTGLHTYRSVISERNGKQSLLIYALKENENLPISTLQETLTRKIRSTVTRTFTFSAIAARLFLQSPQLVKAEEIAKSLKPFLSLDCDDSIVILSQPTTGRVILMIGTAHISENSVDIVRRTIQKAQPDTVMIELDPKRTARAGVTVKEFEAAGFLLPKETILASTTGNNVEALPSAQRKSIFDQVKQAIVSPIQQLAQAAAGAALGKVIGSFYQSVEKLGFNAGGEFKAAVEEGKKINAKILLGDRDVDITLQRLATAVSTTDPDKLSATFAKVEEIEDRIGIDSSELDENVTKEELKKFVESLKQKQLIIELMNTLKQDLPPIYNALVGERDQYMAKAALEVENSKILVGVVGLAHLAGIESILTTKGNFQSIKRNCPLPSSSSRK